MIHILSRKKRSKKQKIKAWKSVNKLLSRQTFTKNAQCKVSVLHANIGNYISHHIKKGKQHKEPPFQEQYHDKRNEKVGKHKFAAPTKNLAISNMLGSYNNFTWEWWQPRKSTSFFSGGDKCHEQAVK